MTERSNPDTLGDDGAAPTTGRGVAWTDAAAIGGSIACAFVITWPLIARLSTHVPIPRYLIGEPWRHVYWFEIWSVWLVQHIALWRLQFFTRLIFFPVGVYIPWLSQSLSTVAVASLLHPFAAAVTIGNVLTIAALAAAAYGGFLLARDVTGDSGAAFVAGVVYASAPIVTANAQGHLYVITSLFEQPLYLLFLQRLLESPKPRYAAGAGIVFAVSLVSYWYCPVFLAIYTVVFVMVDLAQRRPHRAEVWRLARAAALSVAIAGFAFAALLVPFLLPAARTWPSGALQAPISEIQTWSVDLLAFLLPPYDHWLLGQVVAPVRATFSANPTLQTDYVGLVSLACVVIAAVRRTRVAARWLSSAAVFFVLAVGPVLHVGGASRLHLPHAFVYSLPPFSGVRDLSMYAVPLMLSIAVLAAIGVAYVRRRAGAVRPFVVPVAIALVFADVAILPFPLYAAAVPAVYSSIAHDPVPGTVVELPWSTTIPIYEYYQTVHGRPLLTGYLNRLEPWYLSFAQDSPVVQLLTGRIASGPVPRRAADDFLRLFDVRYVVIHRAIAGEEEFNRLSDAAATVLGGRLVDADRDLAAYRINTPPAPALPLQVDFSPGVTEPVLKFGWSDAERRDGITAAWVDGTRSSLWADLPSREPLTIAMRLEPAVRTTSEAETMRVSLNGRPIYDVRLRPGWTTYDVTVPADVISTGPSRLDFTYGFCVVPAAVDPRSADTRCLSVAFDFVRIDTVARP